MTMTRSLTLPFALFVGILLLVLACRFTPTPQPVVPTQVRPDALAASPTIRPTRPHPTRPPASPTSPSLPPVYVTVALHIENARAFADCQAYPDFRRKLLQFAEAMAPYPIAVNLQIDYEFLLGVARCETPDLQADTEGQNILAYLAARYGYEIDPHQEGGRDVGRPDNYADIRYLAGQLTDAVSETMGGLVWDDPAQWQALAQGEAGQLHPEYVWRPQVLTLAVSSRHHEGDFSADDFSSGVWRPKGPGEVFWTHDPNGPWVYIGPGEYDNWGGKWGKRTTPAFVRHLLDQLERGALDPRGMYTATLAVPQHIVFNPDRYFKLQGLLDELTPLVDSGRVVYATYSEVVQIWEKEYQSRPSLYRP